jgi:hypothetical protein
MYVIPAFVPLHQADVQIILGGGQDAMSVTTTGSRQGKFEALFWHKLFEEEIGRVKGHLYVPLPLPPDPC